MAASTGFAWEHHSDEDLRKVAIGDLGVRLEGTELVPRIRQLHAELALAGLTLRPQCYLADEWFTPDGETAIGIPFFLAHPRLRALEFRMMLEVEGGTRSWCMRILRHEAGHALDHAFGLNRTREWRRVFGSPAAPYSPELYLVDPLSRSHVRNLPDHYAQCHPEEDFAETFAVWLNPLSQWRSRYAGWPAMRKLNYIARLARRLKDQPTPRVRNTYPYRADRLHTTLDSYYRRKFRMYHLDDLGFAAPVLRSIFRSSRATGERDRAAAFLRAQRRDLVDSIARWSGQKPREVGKVVTALARLADEHNLVLRDRSPATLVRISTYVATLVLNRLHTHTYRLRRPL